MIPEHLVCSASELLPERLGGVLPWATLAWMLETQAVPGACHLSLGPGPVQVDFISQEVVWEGARLCWVALVGSPGWLIGIPEISWSFHAAGTHSKDEVFPL